jgi:hypothetical protein
MCATVNGVVLVGPSFSLFLPSFALIQFCAFALFKVLRALYVCARANICFRHAGITAAHAVEAPVFAVGWKMNSETGARAEQS